MEQKDMEMFLRRFAEQIDELQIEVAALGTGVRALIDMSPDKEALRVRFNQVMSHSKTAPLSPQSLAEHEARHEALLRRM